MKRVIELSKKEADRVLISYVRERDGLPIQDWPEDSVDYNAPGPFGIYGGTYTVRLVIK